MGAVHRDDLILERPEWFSPYTAHYAVSKGAVITWTRSLAHEYARKGITVNNIPPSSIRTRPTAR